MLNINSPVTGGQSPAYYSCALRYVFRNRALFPCMVAFTSPVIDLGHRADTKKAGASISVRYFGNPAVS